MPPTKPSTLHPNPYPSAWPHNPALSIWLSVDPLSDKYPGVSPYTYCGNNPVRLVDKDGREIIYPDDRPFGRSNYEQSYVKRKDSAHQNQNHTVGWGFSVDANVSISSIGFSIELGYVNDGKDQGRIFFSHGASVGFEMSLGLNAIAIPSADFNLKDFEGKSMSINVSSPWLVSTSLISDYSAGAERDYYFNNYGGLKVGVGLGVGASMSHTKTRFVNIPPVNNKKN